MQPAPLDVDRVREVAASLGIDSISELSRRCGIDRAHLSRILGGKRRPQNSHVIALAKALGCERDDLLFVDEVRA